MQVVSVKNWGSAGINDGKKAVYETNQLFGAVQVFLWAVQEFRRQSGHRAIAKGQCGTSGTIWGQAGGANLD